MKTKFYIGQPVINICDDLNVTLFDPDIMHTDYYDPIPDLPNTWYEWDGGTEPPCDPGQEVLVQLMDGSIFLDEAGRFNWEHMLDGGNIIFYMIIKAPEVIE